MWAEIDQPHLPKITKEGEEKETLKDSYAKYDPLLQDYEGLL